MKIYDCFCFFNELMLLKVRIEELKDIVDTFVIVEATKTLSGKRRELVLRDRLSEFTSDKYKIIYIVLDDYDTSFIKNSYDDRHAMMHAQRELFKLGLKGANEDDIVMFSDLDEIPSKKAVKSLPEENLPVGLLIQHHFYYFNTPILFPPWHTKFNGVQVHKYKEFKNLNLEEARSKHASLRSVDNGGWHFGYLAEAEEISEKIKASSHTEYAHLSENIDSIKYKRENLIDLYGRHDFLMVPTPLDDRYPAYVLKNKEELKRFIYNV